MSGTIPNQSSTLHNEVGSLCPNPELDVMATFVTQTEDSLLQSEDLITSGLPLPPGVNHR